MKLNILKCHGSGNDFILLDEITGIAIPEDHRANLTRLLCDRTTGFGADGVLFYLVSNRADCQMRMFNPDGGEAEMCGNGLRCVGRYCAEQQMKNKVSVETMKAVLSVERGKQIYDGIETFEAEIGPISLKPSSLPMVVDSDAFANEHLPELSNDLRFTALSVPNPHIVTMVDVIDETLINQCGLAANNSPTFPNGVNVSFVRNLGDNRIFVVTYERGVGITFSCGTAMSASAYVSGMNGVTDRSKPIYVFNNGGMVVCDVSDVSGNIILKGNATFVFEATVEISEDFQSIEQQHKGKIRVEETSAYESLQDYARIIAA